MAYTLTVNGTVTSNGSPVAGVTVELHQAVGPVADTDVTDGAGAYSVSHTEATETGESHWTVATALPPHYQEGTGSSVAHSHTTVTRNITMPFANANPTTTQAATPRTFEEDTGSYTGDFTKADADGDSTSVVKVSGPAFGSLSAPNASTGRWTWDTNHVTASPGAHVFQYKVTDSFGANSTTRSVTVNITEANTPPDLDPPGNKSYANKSGVQQFQLIANDAEDDPITYSKQSGPAWVTCSSSGLVSVNTNSSTRGVHAVEFRATALGGSDNEAITITITNNAPVMTNPGNQQYTTNSGTKQLQLSATDADGDTKTFSKTAGQAWGTVTSGGLITFAIGSTVAGTYPFTFQVSDGQGGTDSESFNVILVDPVPSPFFQMQG